VGGIAMLGTAVEGGMLDVCVLFVGNWLSFGVSRFCVGGDCCNVASKVRYCLSAYYTAVHLTAETSTTSRPHRWRLCLSAP